MQPLSGASSPPSLETGFNNYSIFNDSIQLCSEDFFLNDDGDCKPNCNHWTMNDKPVDTALRVILGTSIAIGIMTTIVIITVSFVSFRKMQVHES